MRPNRIQTFIELAHVWSKRATCHRLNVGAIIVIGRNAVSHGYNGVPSGIAHCVGNACPGKFVCKETIHAEVNALGRIPKELRGQPFDIYTTDSPCPDCAGKLYDAGVKRVFFSTAYRITDALDALIEQGVEVYRVTPAGYVIEWKSKDVVTVEV